MPDSTVTDLRQFYASEETLYFLLVLANIGVIFFSLSTMITWVYWELNKYKHMSTKMNAMAVSYFSNGGLHN